MSEPGGPSNHPPINGENGNPVPIDPNYDYDPPTANFPLPDVNNPPSFLSGEQNPDRWDPRSGEKPTRKQVKELAEDTSAARQEVFSADNIYYDQNIATVDATFDVEDDDGKIKEMHIFDFGSDGDAIEPFEATRRFRHAKDDQERNQVVSDIMGLLEHDEGAILHDADDRNKLEAQVRESLSVLSHMADDPIYFSETMHAMRNYRKAQQLEEEARLARSGGFAGRVSRGMQMLANTPRKIMEVAQKHPKAAIGLGVVGAAAFVVLKTDAEMYIADTASDIFNDVTSPSEVTGQPMAAVDTDSGQVPQPEDRGNTSPSQAPQSAPEATGAGAADTTPQGSTVPPDEVEPDGGSGGAADQKEEPPQPPPVEPLEITDEQREVTSGMGWNEKLEQLGVNPEHNGDLMQKIGPGLEERGLAYWSEDAKEWRMKSLEDGISDEDLQWIHEQAATNGFLAEQAPAPAPAAEPEPSTMQPDGSIETAKLGEYSGDINPETGYLEGTGYNAVATALEDQAEMLGIKGIDFTQLQQQPGFNSAYHEFVGEVLQQNGLDWESARSMNGGDKLTIPPETLQKFLTEQGIFTPPDTLANTDLLDLSPGATAPAAAETASLGNLPSYSEIQATDTYETVFERVFENNPEVPAEMRGDPQMQREFLNNLVSDRDQLSELYAGVPVNALSTSWNSFLSETIFIPQVEQNGTWYIHPKFIENALGLMQTFLNPTVETGAGA